MPARRVPAGRRARCAGHHDRRDEDGDGRVLRPAPRAQARRRTAPPRHQPRLCPARLGGAELQPGGRGIPPGPLRGVQHRRSRRTRRPVVPGPVRLLRPQHLAARGAVPAPGTRGLLPRRAPCRAHDDRHLRRLARVGRTLVPALRGAQHDDDASQQLRTTPGRSPTGAGADAHGRPHRLRRRHRSARRPGARARDRRPRRRLAPRSSGTERARAEPRRPPRRVDERPLAIDHPPRRAAPARCGGFGPAAIGGLLLRRRLRRHRRVPPDVLQHGAAGAIPPGARRRSPHGEDHGAAHVRADHHHGQHRRGPPPSTRLPFRRAGGRRRRACGGGGPAEHPVRGSPAGAPGSTCPTADRPARPLGRRTG